MATAGALRGAANGGVDAAAAAAAARRGGVAGCARGAACLPRRGAAAAARAPPPPRAPRLRQPPCRRLPVPRAADGADAPPSAPPPPPTPRVVRIKVRALRSRALSPLVPRLKRLTVADSACVPPRPLRCQPEDMPTKDDYKPSCVAHAARLARPAHASLRMRHMSTSPLVAWRRSMRRSTPSNTRPSPATTPGAQRYALHRFL
jgi:hypothetical protein